MTRTVFVTLEITVADDASADDAGRSIFYWADQAESPHFESCEGYEVREAS